MESVSLYSEAKNEYLKQLSNWIIPPIVEFFRKEYDSISKRENRRAMAAFQTFCSEVPRWNQDVIEANINTILDNCRCDYIEELMTAVFIAHTKMLTAIRVSTKQKKLKITLPKLDHFLHRVFVECARVFWKAPFLFADDLSPVEKQKNVLQAETMCNEALSSAVRSLLPVKSILKDYLDEDDEEEIVEKVATKKKTEESDSEDESSEDELENDAPAPAPAPVPAPAPAPVPVEPVVPVETPIVSEPPTVEDKKPIIVEKLDTVNTSPSVPAESMHSVTTSAPANGVNIEKIDSATSNSNPPKLLIETEPVVHFTPYDTVFDENKEGVSEIRYAPKVSVEDKPPSNWGIFEDDDEEDIPKLAISGEGTALDLSDIDDIDGGSSKKVEEDEVMEMDLATTSEFESL